MLIDRAAPGISGGRVRTGMPFFLLAARFYHQKDPFVNTFLLQFTAGSGRHMRITEKMPAGTTYQISCGVRARIYPRSQPESRLAFFGEDYAPFTAGVVQLPFFDTDAIIDI